MGAVSQSKPDRMIDIVNVLYFLNSIVSMSRKITFALFLFIVLFAGRPVLAQPQEASGPVVTVRFDYSPKDRKKIRVLERRLASSIALAKVGQLGETEFHADGDEGFLYLYGPDSDRLYMVARPILKSSKLMAGAEVTKRHGSSTEKFVIHQDGSQ